MIYRETPDLYCYKAEVTRIIDGDTIDVTLDMGFRTYCRQRLRLLGFDAPERGQPGFQESTEALTQLLMGAKQVIVQTVKTDSFGRWLANVQADGTWVTDYMQFWLNQGGYSK